ncbi:DMT family transporter [Solidesulfovibrio sp.]|uniref:DMT family transporter n=1 Tax=Solidesulfovibrio sp. TaxID=2910990 RepID=UPI002B203662|nr:DMT family transporter [Solidesulfovibrio sp.]MEA5089803.1 DMT family transporter [Solidesulfovibrio sp.]
MAERGQGRAALLLAVTAFLWSTGGVAIKLAPLSPMAVTGGRSLLAALTLWLLFRGRLDFRLTRPFVCAALGYAGLLVTNVAATKLTTAANAILLAYTAPVYVALFAPAVLKEPTRPADWAFVAATVGGMALFFLDKLSPAGLWGNVLAVGTGISYAVFTLAMRAGRDGGLVAAVVAGHLLTAAAGLPFLLAGPPRDAAAWLGLAYLGVVQQGLSLALYVWCIKRLRALTAICIMTLEPVLNPVFVALGCGELPGRFAVLGGIVVVGAVTLRAVFAGRRAGA